MGKIGLITWREYITRVRKRSFLIMTILGPVLIASFYGIIIYLAVSDSLSSDQERVMVYDEANLVESQLRNDDKMEFGYGENWEHRNPDSLSDQGYTGWLKIPADFNIYEPGDVIYESTNSLSLESKERINHRISETIENGKMLQFGVSKSALDSIDTRVSITTFTVDEEGKSNNSSTELYTGIGMVLSFIIYFFIFLYGVQVMRGVIEEKTNRIVEVIVSSVKPFQLMMGKVFGLAMVGLTQIVIWVVLSMLLVFLITMGITDAVNVPEVVETVQGPAGQQAQEMVKGGVQNSLESLIPGLASLNFPLIIGTFLIYFLGGYLMYSSLFAAVGAAVDAETDTQQFMLPITMPLVLSIALSTSIVIRDPNGPLSFWLSMIPLTSPVVMMVRAPFLNPANQWWELALSVGILVLAFCFTIWLAGRIYRTGILMYGKKATYKEMFKWLFYRG